MTKKFGRKTSCNERNEGENLPILTYHFLHNISEAKAKNKISKKRKTNQKMSSDGIAVFYNIVGIL